jgi:hypothetical protein
MSISKSKIVDEIESWRAFADALREEDRGLFRQMVQQCYEYLPAMEARSEPFPSESLFMGLIFMQHRIIEELSEQVRQLHAKRAST